MKEKSVLFIANSDRHINLCHIPYIKMFKENGYIVDVATNTDKKIDYCDNKIKLSLKRNPFSFSNIKAIKEVRKLAKQNNYDIISCHTPIGGFLGRVAVINQNLKTKVFYIAHGFHFYKNCPLFNKIIYYNIEKFLSSYTTCILTMNKEDYNIAKTKFKCDVYKINGIGYDSKKLKINSNNNLRNELNLQDKYIVTYIAEISKRKNQKKFLKVLNKYNLEKYNIKVLLIGDSNIKNFDKYVKKYKDVIYIDFVNNVGDYINMSDLIISPSIQEGLPLNIIEAMSFNKFIVATDIRGTNDLIEHNKNGILVPVNDLDLFVKEIIKAKNTKINVKNNMDKYLIENVLLDVKKIYNNYLEGKLK